MFDVMRLKTEQTGNWILKTKKGKKKYRRIKIITKGHFYKVEELRKHIQI